MPGHDLLIWLTFVDVISGEDKFIKMINMRDIKNEWGLFASALSFCC